MTGGARQTAAAGDWRAALAVYLRPRVLLMVLLGFASGLPLALSGSTLSIWMADRGIDLGTIGLFSLVGLPYTLKFLWAPVVDAWHVPVLGALGQRRGWLLATQIALLAAVAGLAQVDPVGNPLGVALGALAVAFFSASHDIVIDAWRIERLEPGEQAAGMATYVAAYRVALLVSGAGALALVSWLETRGLSKPEAWPWAFLGCAALGLVGILATLLADEPARRSTGPEPPGALAPLAAVVGAAVAAFRDFLGQPAAAAVLLLVVLFKLCDALAGVMTGPFVLAIGFDKATYAAIVKGVGLAATLAGGFCGGLVARAWPLERALWLAAFVQMASNLAFTGLALAGPDLRGLTAAVVVESFTGGIGTVIFVAYLSALCRTPLHTATQFALLTALSAVGRTLSGSPAGFAAAGLGWPWFFTASALAAVPSLALLAWLGRRGHFRGLVPARLPAALED